MAFLTNIFRNLHLKCTVPKLVRTLTTTTVPEVLKYQPNPSILAVNPSILSLNPSILSANPSVLSANPSVHGPSIRQNIIKIELPVLNKNTPIGWVPHTVTWIEEPKENLDMEMPGNIGEAKHAVRMIVIRRKKMKKHKLKKLRKRMKFEWAKRKQRRELKKEKEFQAVLIQQYKTAEQFSAEKYVEERLAKFNEVITPFDWKEFYYVNPADRKK